MLYNQRTYESGKYGNDSHLGKELMAKSLNIDLTKPMSRRIYLQELQVESEEHWFNPGWLQPSEAKIYQWMDEY